MKRDDFTSEQARWQAVESRDARADERFVFAVVTTGIFCRPSCRARRPLRDNVRFYPDAAGALAAGFRPCKRCQPDKTPPQQQKAMRIAAACRQMETSAAPLTLAELAQNAAMSPYHFHRLFKSVTGLTPKAWQQALRAQKLRKALREGESVTGAIYASGYASGSAFYREADAALGMTARQYLRGGETAPVDWTIVSCQLGLCLVAQSERGVCAIFPGESRERLESELLTLFPHAQPSQDADFHQRVAQVVAFLDAPAGEWTLPLDIRGTAFQQQVWQALRAIPAGSTLSYSELAQKIGKPGAVRAVASACAANKLAVAIPCHRVVRGDGALSGYRWGVERKAALLAREAKIKKKES